MLPTIRRQKMEYHCKFGDFGAQEACGRITKPLGISVNAENEIVIADNNNHRIQVFDKKGSLKFQFGLNCDQKCRLFCPDRYVYMRTTDICGVFHPAD